MRACFGFGRWARFRLDLRHLWLRLGRFRLDRIGRLRPWLWCWAVTALLWPGGRGLGDLRPWCLGGGVSSAGCGWPGGSDCVDPSARPLMTTGSPSLRPLTLAPAVSLRCALVGCGGAILGGVIAVWGGRRCVGLHIFHHPLAASSGLRRLWCCVWLRFCCWTWLGERLHPEIFGEGFGQHESEGRDCPQSLMTMLGL